MCGQQARGSSRAAFPRSESAADHLIARRQPGPFWRASPAAEREMEMTYLETVCHATVVAVTGAAFLIVWLYR